MKSLYEKIEELYQKIKDLENRVVILEYDNYNIHPRINHQQLSWPTQGTWVNTTITTNSSPNKAFL
jgi:hypothetical protein